MSENSSTTPNPVETPALTPSEKPVTPPKPSELVSLLNEPDPSLDPSKTPPKTEETPPKEGEKKTPVEGAPEKYEDFKLPDGVEISTELMTEASGMFKELNLTQANAQRLVDFHAKALTAAAEAPITHWRDQQTAWRNEIKADPEIGGKLGAVKASIGRMYDSLGDSPLVASFREAMDLTGAGNHPAFVKLMFKVSERLGEGKPVDGGNPPGGGKPRTGAAAMYPNLPSASG